LKNMFDRRQVLASGLAGGLAAVLPSSARAQANGFTMTSLGGGYEQTLRRTVIEPFSKQFGAEIALKLGSPAEWLTNAMVNKRRPELDLLLLTYPDSIRAVLQDVCQTLDPAEIPNLKDVIAPWYDQYNRAGVGFGYISYGIAYREDLVKTPLTTWADLWKPEYKGMLSVPHISAVGGWEMLVVAARQRGGDEGNLEPGFAALKDLKPNVRNFFRSPVEAIQTLESGEAPIMVVAADSRIYLMQDAGRPVRYVLPKEGALAGMGSLHIAKNTQKADLCKKFINFALSKDVQESFSNTISGGPVNKMAVLTGKAKERVARPDQLMLFDWKKIIPSMPQLTDRWNRELA
jgi:putative spermidine/putrescine transport system substrate-binding protein